MKIKNIFIYKKIWFSFFIVKVSYMFFALFVYSKLTQLGDTESYLNGYHFSPESFLFSSTAMVGTLAFILNSTIGYILTNLFFVVLSFIGIYYSVTKLNLNNKELFAILALLSLPSFGIWSSIAGKEAVSVFFMGILAGYIIDYYNQRRRMNSLELFAIYLGLIFKPHFILPILLILLYLKIRFIFKSKAIQFFTIIIMLIISISIIYFFRFEINDLSLTLPKYFSTEGSATRTISFWQNDFDYIKKIPEGVYLSFMGPTLSESLARLNILPIYIESVFIASFFMFYIFLEIIKIIKYKKINILKIAFFIFVFLALLILAYPLGVSNYGAAIRYREGYLAFFTVMFFFVFIKNFGRINEKNHISI